MENIKESTFVVRKLTVADGFYLTQSLLEEGEERVFTKVAFLAQEQPTDYWREATEQERQEFLDSMKEENNME